MIAETPREKVKRAIRNLIEKQKLQPGDRIPTELVLTKQIDVSRDTVRFAIKELEQDGVLQGSKSKTRRVAQTIRPSGILNKTVIILSSFDPPKATIGLHKPGQQLLELIEISIRQRLAKIGFHSMHINPLALSIEELQALAESQIAGVIAMSDAADDVERLPALIQVFESKRIPCIINGQSFGQADSVDFDHAAGTELLVDALIKEGCRRIVRVWGGDNEGAWLNQRNEGYLAACKRHKIQVFEEIIVPSKGDFFRKGVEDPENAFRGLINLFVGSMFGTPAADPDTDAILLGTDQDFFAASRALHRIHPNRPPPLLAGYDAVWRASAFSGLATLGNEAPRFTIDKQNERAGAQIVDLLERRINGFTAPPVRELVPPLLIDTKDFQENIQ